MKKLVYIVLFLPFLGLGQTRTENYVKSTLYKVKTLNDTTKVVNGNTVTLAEDEDKLESITYFDGLGRPKQSIAIRAGGNSEDIITHIGYDDFGRQVKNYLPYAANSNAGEFRTGAIENTINQFYLDKYPEDFAGVSLPNVNAYSEKVFDNSPLNRVLEQTAPGKDWKVGTTFSAKGYSNDSHSIKFEYGTNSSNEVLNFGVNFTNNNTDAPELSIATSYYNPNELYKTITKDENWKTWEKKDRTTEEFKNKQGQVLLKRTYNSQQAHDTYYVYDDFGNLTYVLPPLASEKTIIYETGMKTYPVSDFVTGGNATGSITFGIQATSTPGQYQYVADIDLHNLANSTFKSGEIMDLPFMYPSMSNFWLGSVSASKSVNGSYAYKYISYYVNEGKLMSYVYEYNRNNIPLVITDFDRTTRSNLPQNLQGFSEAATQQKVDELLDKLCYQYKYDDRNRLVEKKIPGKGWEYIVYDKLDRPVLTQDANHRKVNNSSLSSDKWLFTKYDVMGRVAFTGIYAKYGSRINLQTNVNSYSSQYVTSRFGYSPTMSYYSNSGEYLFYNNESYSTPFKSSELFTINYYDDYVDLPAGLSSTITTSFGVTSTTKTKGLPTVSKVRVLETDDWITTVTYYDEKARPIYIYSKNDYLNTIDIIESELDFTGKVLQTNSIHKKTNVDDIEINDTEINDTFEYDHADRLLSQTQQINSQAAELIVKNNYDALGQLIKKDVGNTIAAPLQEVDYTYNVRGWLKKINDPEAGLKKDLFAFELLYNDPGSNLNNSKLYNGNISQTIWKTANDNAGRYYNYYYDDLNRITRANYYSWNQYSRFNLGSISYDKNGNIQRLYRRGAIVDQPDVENSLDYGNMDNLTYSYDGNKLLNVNDTGDKNYGFKNGSNEGYVDDYDYDANGNMVKDYNKGISNISYNHLNLPTLVDFGNNKYIQYTYDATGSKIRKRVRNVSTFTNTDYAGNYIYNNNDLQFFNTPEGYATPNSSGNFDYIYQYKDHLGNVRVSYTENTDIDIPETVFYDNATNTQGWDSNGPSYGVSAPIATDKSYSGGKSFKIHSTSGSRYAHSNQRISINNSEPTEYTFSGRIFVESAGYAWGRILLFMDDEDGNSTEVEHGDAIKTKGQWIYYEKTVTVPANIDKINLRIGLYHQTNNATAWFDDLKIVKGNLSRTTIVEESNYYPFGLKHKGYNNVVSSNGNSTAQKFGYNGKELEESLGLNLMEMDVRSYDPAIARWTGIDPVTHHSMSPYVAFDNNPVFWADPSGADGVQNIAGMPGSSLSGVTPDNQTQQKSKTGFTDALARLEAEAELKTNDCPKCDNENILLDFMESAAIKNGILKRELATTSYTSEDDDLYSDPTIYGSTVNITGLKYNKRWFQFMNGDKDTYPFKQNFEINGREFTANALILIYKDSELNNISSMSLPITSKDYVRGTQHVINFYNDKGGTTATLSFKNKQDLRNFTIKYYHNKMIRAYNTDPTPIPIKD